MPAKKSTYVERIVAWEAGLVYHQAAARISTPRDAGRIMREWHAANPYPTPDAPKKTKAKKSKPAPVPESTPEPTPADE